MNLVDRLKVLMRDECKFIELASQLTLRRYQIEVAQTVARSVRDGLGLSIVVMFPRQSGKNELQAQIEVYLLTLFSLIDAEIVKVSPTWRPQSLNAMARLERVLKINAITRSMWEKREGYIFRVGRASIKFLSGAPEANVVGATASTLLEVDEAQDVLANRYDVAIAPMAASTNATRVFWGTAWTSKTLLARELRAARKAEELDGIRRTFVLTAEDVGREVPAYRAFVAEQVAKLGRNHPSIKTQYFSEEIDAEGGMFPEQRRALMRGEHAALNGPRAGGVYALLLDVAGEDEGVLEGGEGEPVNGRRDSTALTIVEVDLATMADPVLKAPVYRVVARRSWVGVRHSRLYGEIRALAESWRCRFLVADATGIGAGLVSFLDKALPGRVLPFEFNSSTKSRLGWDFLGVVETGRWKEPAKWGPGCYGLSEQAEFFRQLEYCQYEILPGPSKSMRWGVPDGTREAGGGDLVHDDLVLSAALCAVLDLQEWVASGPALVVQRADPLAEMDRGGY
jgi:hypothetical protein